MLSINNITKIYHNSDGDLTSLKDISFTVNTGELVTIFGPNGSGKTTLFNAIAGLESVTSGEILYDGKEKSQDLDIGFVFQNYNKCLCV